VDASEPWLATYTPHSPSRTSVLPEFFDKDVANAKSSLEVGEGWGGVGGLSAEKEGEGKGDGRPGRLVR
jgi:hypothetical protein